jgi:hypothetical protein
MHLPTAAPCCWPPLPPRCRRAPCATAPRQGHVAGWSKPITEVTPLLVDEDKPFYRAQGIALEYVPGAGGGDAIRNILSGQADVAFTDPGSLFAALDKGEKLRAIYDIYPQNVFNVVSLRKSGIRKPADLKGKRIGVYSLSSGTRQNLQVLLHLAGLKESDVTMVVTGLLNFAPLLQGQVDATAATDTGLLVGRRRGLVDVDVMEVGKVLNVSSDLFVVREDVYRKRKRRAAALPARLPRQRGLDDRQPGRGRQPREQARHRRQRSGTGAGDHPATQRGERVRPHAAEGPGRDGRRHAAEGGRRVPPARPGAATDRHGAGGRGRPAARPLKGTRWTSQARWCW